MGIMVYSLLRVALSCPCSNLENPDHRIVLTVIRETALASHHVGDIKKEDCDIIWLCPE